MKVACINRTILAIPSIIKPIKDRMRIKDNLSPEFVEKLLYSFANVYKKGEALSLLSSKGNINSLRDLFKKKEDYNQFIDFIDNNLGDIIVDSDSVDTSEIDDLINDFITRTATLQNKNALDEACTFINNYMYKYTKGNQVAYVIPIQQENGIEYTGFVRNVKTQKQAQREFDAQHSQYGNEYNVLPHIYEEMMAIKEKAVKNGTFMKAPNGKPTNLDERQWLLVRTKAFKDWFGEWEHPKQIEKTITTGLEVSSANTWIDGSTVIQKGNSYFYVNDNGANIEITKKDYDDFNNDKSIMLNKKEETIKTIDSNYSKVLDENGEPLVMYHRSNDNIFIFDINKSRHGGFWFSKDPNYYVNTKAKLKYAIPVFLNIRTPNNINHELFERAIDGDKFTEGGIKTTQFDGWITNDIHTPEFYGDDYSSSIVFAMAIDPNQIKSATDNVGTFSTENDDIRYSSVDEESYTPEMEEIKSKAIFDGNFMKAPNGKDSNLNERQWLLVRTKAFKEWFGDWEKGLTIKQDNKSYYRGQYDEPVIDKDGNLRLKGRRDDLYNRVGYSVETGVSATTDMITANEYGETRYQAYIGDIEDKYGELDNSWEKEEEINEIIEHGYYLIQFPKNISNEVIKEAGEVKLVGDVIIPKGSYVIQHITNDNIETIATATNNDSKVVDENGEPLVVYHGSPNKFDTFDTSKISSTQYDINHAQEVENEHKSSRNETPKVSIPQNRVSGQYQFGWTQTASPEIIAQLGKNPTSIDMVEAGFRTRTTRSASEAQKYNLQVGDVFEQYGKAADGTTKKVLTKVTAIYGKDDPRYLDNWSKEGWTDEGIDDIKRLKDGAQVIEFELINQKTINIYDGTNENAHLSNFAQRPFVHTWEDGSTTKFESVEQAFQYAKAKIAGDTDIANRILNTTKGSSLRNLGKQVKNLNISNWDRNKVSFMRTFIRESFEQNKKALIKLLETGNAVLTHTQDNSQWRELFPKLLMEVRDELRSQFSNQSNTGLEVTPINPKDAKAISKAKIANKYIGYGIKGSSTKAYADQISNNFGEEYVNSDTYSNGDVVFVSINGKRGGAAIRHQLQDNTINLALEALKAGATLITDNAEYTANSDYNEGEKKLAEALRNAGAIYSETTVDGNVLGVWSKSSSKQTTRLNTVLTTPTLQQLSNDALKRIKNMSIEERLNFYSDLVRQLKQCFDNNVRRDPDFKNNHKYYVMDSDGEHEATVTMSNIKKKGHYGNNGNGSLKIGNIVDDAIRQFFSHERVGVFSTNDITSLSKESAKSLIELINKLQEYFDKKFGTYKTKDGKTHRKYKVFTNFKDSENPEFTVGGKYCGEYIAGTLDMIVVDSDGNLYIYDIKTTKNSKDVYLKESFDGHKKQVQAYRDTISKGLLVYNIQLESPKMEDCGTIVFQLSKDPNSGEYEDNGLISDSKIRKDSDLSFELFTGLNKGVIMLFDNASNNNVYDIEIFKNDLKQTVLLANEFLPKHIANEISQEAACKELMVKLNKENNNTNDDTNNPEQDDVLACYETIDVITMGHTEAKMLGRHIWRCVVGVAQMIGNSYDMCVKFNIISKKNIKQNRFIPISADKVLSRLSDLELDEMKQDIILSIKEDADEELHGKLDWLLEKNNTSFGIIKNYDAILNLTQNTLRDLCGATLKELKSNKDVNVEDGDFDISNLEEGSVIYGIESREKSYIASLSQEVKNCFNFIRNSEYEVDENNKLVLDENGMPIEIGFISDGFGYNIETYKDRTFCITKFFDLFHGCETSEQLKAKIKEKVVTTPWLSLIYEMLENNPDLATKFVVSVNKNKTTYSYVYKTTLLDAEGKEQLVLKLSIANVSLKIKAIQTILINNFYTEQKIGVFNRIEGESNILFKVDTNESKKLNQLLRQNVDRITKLTSLFSLIGLPIEMLPNIRTLAENDKAYNKVLEDIKTFKNKLENKRFEIHDIVDLYRGILYDVLLAMDIQYELSSRIGEKTYSTFNNVSEIERTVSSLNGENGVSNVEDVLGKDSFFGKYRTYRRKDKNGLHYINTIFRKIYENSGEVENVYQKLLKYTTIPSVDGKGLFKLSDHEYMALIILSYFGPEMGMSGDDTRSIVENYNLTHQGSKPLETKDVAYFRVGTMSDKPASDYIRFEKPVKFDFDNSKDLKKRIDKFENEAAEQMYEYFLYEISRARSVVEQAAEKNGAVLNFHLKQSDANTLTESGKITKDENGVVIGKLTKEDLADENGKLTKIFEGSGMSFKFLPMFNDVISMVAAKKGNDTENKFVEMLLLQLNEGKVSNKSAFIHAYNKIFKKGMRKYWENSSLKNEYLGLFDLELRDIIGTKEKEYMFMELFYNDFIMAANTYNMLIGDIAYYKNTIDLQKRFAEVHASSVRCDIDARIKKTGKLYSDGKMRVITIADPIEFNNKLANLIETIFKNKNKELLRSGDRMLARLFEILAETIPAALRQDGVNVTDGQGYGSPTSFWKKLHLLGEATEEGDEAIRQIRTGKITIDNLNTAIQEFKPFVHSMVHKNGRTSLGDEAVSMQIKDSEAMIALAGAIVLGTAANGLIQENIPLVEMFNIMEASHYGKLNEYFKGTFDSRKYFNQEDVSKKSGDNEWFLNEYVSDGIDNIVFASAVKNGAVEVLDLWHDEKGNELKGESLRRNIRKQFEKCINKKGDGSWTYNTDVVREIDFRGWGKQQNNPAHLRDHEQDVGSQIKMISIENIPEDFTYTTTDGETINGRKDFLQHYFDILKKDYELGVNEVIKKFGLEKQVGKIKNGHIVTKDEILAKIVRESLLKDLTIDQNLINATQLVPEWDIDNKTYKLKFKYPIGDPSVSPKFFSAVFSVIKREVNSQTLPGGPIVLVAPTGMSEQLHLCCEDENGKLIRVEDVKNIKDLSGITMEVYVTAPTKEIQRISEGDMRAIEERLKKMNIKENEIEKKKRRIEKLIKNRAYLDPQYLVDEGVLKEEEINFIGYRIPTEDKYSTYRMRIKGFLPRQAGELLIMPKEITWLSGSDYDIDKIYTMFKYAFTNGDKRKLIKNEIYNCIDSTLKHKSTLYSQLNPGSFQKLKDMAVKLGNDMNPKSMLNLDTQLYFRTQNAAGKEFIGISALNNVSHAIVEMANVHFSPESFIPTFYVHTEEMGNDEKGNPIISSSALLVEYSDNTSLGIRIDPEISPLDGSRLSRTIGMFVGASADNAKEAVLGKLNTEPATATVVFGLLRMGIPLSTAVYMINLPMINNLKCLSSSFIGGIMESAQKINKENAQATLNSTVLDDLLLLDVKLGKLDLNKSELVLTAVLYLLSQLIPYCEAINNLNRLVSLNSKKNAVGPTEYKTILKEYDIMTILETNNISEKDVYADDIENLINKTSFLLPLIGAFYDLDSGSGINSLVGRIMNNYSPLYQPNFRKVLDYMFNIGIPINKNTIKKALNAFILFESSRTGNIDLSQKRIETMLSTIREKINQLEGQTSIVKAMLGDIDTQLYKKNKNVYSQAASHVMFLGWLNRDFKEDFTDQIEDLYQFSDKNRSIINDIVLLSVLASGFSWSPISCYSYIPNSVKKNIFASLKENAYSNRDNSYDFPVAEFMQQFILNELFGSIRLYNYLPHKSKSNIEDIEKAFVTQKGKGINSLPEKTTMKISAEKWNNENSTDEIKKFMKLIEQKGFCVLMSNIYKKGSNPYLDNDYNICIDLYKIEKFNGIIQIYNGNHNSYTDNGFLALQQPTIRYNDLTELGFELMEGLSLEDEYRHNNQVVSVLNDENINEADESNIESNDVVKEENAELENVKLKEAQKYIKRISNNGLKRTYSKSQFEELSEETKKWLEDKGICYY